MEPRELAVSGAWEFTPEVFDDERGSLYSPFQEEAFRRVKGVGFFPVAQSNHSLSRKDVVRGVHYTKTPPGFAKYVYCPRGEVLDIVVDLRVGSPSFGVWDAVVLGERSPKAVYFPVGVGHAFIVHEDNTAVSYLLSGSWVPANEVAVSPLDPDLGLPIPPDITPIMSERDRKARSLAEVMAAGDLPDYHTSEQLEKAIWASSSPTRRR